jgi:eukaryotic-like serine/threonine-protein kinase
MSEIGVGTVLGDTYEVLELIGQGGMGQVWSAQHKRLPKKLAVKVLLNIDAGALQDSEGYARFRREAEIASRIGHPNIVEVVDWNTLPSGTPYLVMEYLEGESLARRLKRGAISLAETLGLVRQIGSALHAAHKNEVVHRDLKPDNIFLCPSDSGGVIGDRVKVLDFGISKIRNAGTVLTQESTLMGTPQYMSPEQASGKNSLVDQRTDVFALGAIVYEMLSGKPAFFGETLATVVVKVMLEAPPPLEELNPSLPKDVREAVSRALEKDVNKRFPDVGSFIGALTGSPLQTLDRKKIAAPAANPAFASTEAGTPVPPTNQGPMDAFAATAAGVPTPVVGKPSPNPATVPSLARGEVAVPTEPVVRPPSTKRGGGLLYAALGGVVVLVGVGAVVMLQSHPKVVEPRTADPIPLQVQKPSTPELVVAVADSKPAPPAVEAAKPAAPETKIDAKPETRVDAKPAKPAVAAHAGKHDVLLPPEVLEELDQAEKALRSGDAAEAERLARHSLLGHPNGRAFSVIARALCKKGDLGGAHAALHQVDRGELGRVKRECKAMGVELE